MTELPVVLLPGTLCDRRVWDGMARAWGAQAPPVLLHPLLRGHRSTEAMARSLLQDLPPRFVAVGFSLGGIVALEMAAQAPGRLAGMGLVATNARCDPPANAARRQASVEAARRRGLAAHVRDDLWPAYVAPHRRHDDVLRDVVVQMAVDAGVDVYAEQAEMAARRADGLPRLQHLSCPVLVVGGDDDSINPRDRQLEIASRLRSVEWHQLAGVGHFVPLEAPGELADICRLWLLANCR